MVKYFTIYGERCSGTNFLLSAIEENFDLEFTSKYVWKHFFGHYNFKNTDEENDTLFICIIRNPITWIDSFYKKLHHIPLENRLNIHSFLFNSFYSVYDDGSEILDDRNIITKERYKNIFELRYLKNNFLINEMPKLVKNVILIRYEDLRDKYDTVLDFIKMKFNLQKKNEHYKRVDSYKGYKKIPYVKKLVELRPKIINIIKKNLNHDQENSLGYVI
jgi:hypothetical protein